jgi:hypothetical protein
MLADNITGEQSGNRFLVWFEGARREPCCVAPFHSPPPSIIVFIASPLRGEVGPQVRVGVNVAVRRFIGIREKAATLTPT